MYNRKDHYYKKAKAEGRASRASYKLEQIQEKFRIVQRNDLILDLGCAPGGWLEVLGGMVGSKGLVVGIDILPIRISLKHNVKFIKGDINDDAAIDSLKDIIMSSVISDQSSADAKKLPIADHRSPITGLVDVIVSDMAPNTSGVAFRDCFLSYELCTMALDTAKKMLKEGGNFAAKIFQGKEAEDFKRDLREHFKKVSQYLPPATREGSKEIYIVALGFKSK